MNWKRVIQLTCVHVGVALTAVPISGTLNRILIADLQISALFAALLISLPNLLSPLQVVMGAWADKVPLWGRHRSPWMMIGGLLAAIGSYFTAHSVEWLTDGASGIVLTVVAFLVWGIGTNLASVSYLSLVSELASEGSGWRSRTISVMWTVMILSAIITGIAISRLLDPYSQDKLYAAFGVVWLVASLLIVVGAAGVEPKDVTGRNLQKTVTNPLVAIRTLIGNPTAWRFFFYLMLILIGVRAQDVLLEPFGGEVLKMSVAATTRIESIWGMGVFITLIGGLWLMRRVGKRAIANWGSWISAVSFVLIIFCGYFQQSQAFIGVVFLLGLGSGLSTVSNLSFMIDMTIPEAAGLYMGAWGVANFAGQAIGNLGSGLLRDLFLQLTGSALTGYVVVFAIEAVSLLFAIWYFRSIQVEMFRHDAKVQLDELLVMAVE